ncbi:MAG: phage baseplate assembly protein V [Candidatus Competibacteraceae bacterium]
MEETLLQLVRELNQRRYGKFRGVVSDNRDPEKRGRLKLRVPSVLDQEETDWALPCLPYGGGAGYGLFLVPPPGAQVWVEFEEGDLHRPLWTGTCWQQTGDVPTDAAKSPPTAHLLQTPAGHLVQLDDENGARQLRLHHAGGAELLIDNDGIVTLTDSNGATVTLDAKASAVVVADANGNRLTLNSSGITVADANGNKLELAAAGITVQGQQIVVQGSQVLLGGQGGEPLIKGTSFLSLFATHVHPTPWGPTSPPIPQGEMSALSTAVMTT